MVSGASGAARSQKAQYWKEPNTIGTRERGWQKQQKTRRDMERRTRRSASTIEGAAPDTIIGRAAADRAGARPYHCVFYRRLGHRYCPEGANSLSVFSGFQNSVSAP